MALTEQQKLDVRRYCGYPLVGDIPVSRDNDPAHGWVSPGSFQTLTRRLSTLSAVEEATLIAKFLTPLTTLETALWAAGADLDTKKAAVWERNPNQIQESSALYKKARLALCSFVGVTPGPDISGGATLPIERA